MAMIAIRPTGEEVTAFLEVAAGDRLIGAMVGDRSPRRSCSVGTIEARPE